MKNNISGKSIYGVMAAVVFVLFCGGFVQIFAQQQNSYIIQQAEDAVRDKITRSKGGEVTFPRYGRAETYYISRTKTGVRGYGTWMRNYNSAPQDFSYEARVDTNRDKVDKIKYEFLSDDNGGNGRVPRWAVGTFYGRNPQTGGTITLNINQNGDVEINSGGSRTTYATMTGDRLNNQGTVARVSRLNNGIRTTRLDNGEVIDYFINDNNGGGSDNVPDWAVGTFYGRNPQTGGTIALTINRTGSVVININGSISYATISGDRLNNQGTVARVSRLNNGIRTTRLDNGEIIDYYNRGNDGGGNTDANVPSWAIGTFYARNPQTGGTIALTINQNGNVVINSDGSISYASVNGDRLFNDGIESRLSRTRDGIRTTRLDNGERIDYRRQ